MNQSDRDDGWEVMRSTPSRRDIDSMETLRTYMLGRIPGFKLPDANTWDAEAGELRRTMLEEVIFKGVPDEWRKGALHVEWKDVIETGKGYRIRKLTYRAFALPGRPDRPGRPGQPGLVIPALLYEPDDLRDTTPGVLNLNGHVGPPGKAVDYKQERCINLAKRGMVALNPEWLGFGELQGPGYQHNNAAYLDLCGVAGIAVFYLAMSRALDVLLDQDRVDPERIAVTGLSGGGWQTIILAALATRPGLGATTRPTAAIANRTPRISPPRPIIPCSRPCWRHVRPCCCITNMTTAASGPSGPDHPSTNRSGRFTLRTEGRMPLNSTTTSTRAPTTTNGSTGRDSTSF